MEFQTLKKSHKKQIILGALVVCVIGGALTFATTRAKYKLTQDLELAKGTINYKPYDFKIMAMYKSEDGTNYTEINEMPSSGYTINESKSYCTTDNKTQVKGKVKTVDGKHIITNLKKSDKCYIWFDKTPSAGETILAGITIKDTTPNFATAATTDEGVFRVADPVYGGYSYYWRGAVTNNYVKFGGFCWRIIRINGDGSIRLIYDGTTCHANGTSTAESIAKTSIQYNTAYNNSSYVGWTYTAGTQRTLSGTASNAKTQLESWYTSSLASYASKIADGKYCNDRRTQNDEAWRATGATQHYAGYQRAYSTHQPTLGCDVGDVYTLKVGLITVDEVMMAGGNGGTGNNKYYLYNGQNYWTMSPIYWSGSNAYVFFVASSGGLANDGVRNTGIGLRPVINLKSDTTFAIGGNGTQSNPYVVS